MMRWRRCWPIRSPRHPLRCGCDAEVVEGVDTETGEVEMITQKTQRRQRAQRSELGPGGDDEPFWELVGGAVRAAVHFE